METEICCNAEILAQATQNKMPANWLIDFLFHKIQVKILRVWQKPSIKLACVIADGKDKLK